jgi:hypothetical protein
VTARHVQRLAEGAEITKVARGLVDQSSVERYLAAQRQGRTRSWAEHTAWGAVAELAGRVPEWLGDAQASRVRRALRDAVDADELVTRLRDRARTLTYDAHRAALPRLRAAVVASDPRQLGLTAAAPDELDGYLPAAALDGVVRSLGLRPSPGGHVVLRATAFDAAVVTDLVRTPVVAALDAATSTDPRVRGVGHRTLGDVLRSYR